jgi:hypothetical protein
MLGPLCCETTRPVKDERELSKDPNDTVPVSKYPLGNPADSEVAATFTVRTADALAEPPAPEQVKVYEYEPANAGLTVDDPLVPSEPDHEPLAVQVVALVEDQVKIELCPAAMVAGEAAIVTVGTGALTVALAVAVPVRLLVSVTVSVTVYVPGVE